MLKNKRLLIIILLFCIVIIFFFYIIQKKNSINVFKACHKYILLKLYGEPIDKNTGLINNNFFNIKMDGTDAINTTKGINNAIKYANTHNIEYIKLEKGFYVVEGEKYNSNKERGIQLKSNIVLDFNNSIVKHKQSNQPGYVVCNIENVENVEIKNGIILGDKEEHDYNSINSTHQWGMGVQILGSVNIKIQNLEIYNMTGDGVYLSETENAKTRHVQIVNLNIHDCRRQGISIITADNVIIKNNEIYNINGCGIDFERNFETQTCYDIEVSNNIFYNINNPRYAIFVHDGIRNLNIYSNKLYNSKIQISYPNDTIKAYENEII